MSEDPKKLDSFLGLKLKPPGPATWIGRGWRSYICELLEALINLKVYILYYGTNATTPTSQEAEVTIGPGGTAINIDLTNAQGMGGGGSSIGGVNYQTANYAAVSGDNGKLVSFFSASALTLTLPATPPSSTWLIAVECVGSGGLAISAGAAHIDGGLSAVSLSQNQGLFIFTDGTSYFTSRGVGGGSSQIQGFKIISDGGDYWNCYTWDGYTLGSTSTKVAKPWELMCGTNKYGSATIRGITYTFTYTASGSYYFRSTNIGGGTFSGTVTTDYMDPDPASFPYIYAMAASFNSSSSLTGIVWQDINANGRYWATNA